MLYLWVFCWVLFFFQNMGPLNIANRVWHVRLRLAPWMLADITMHMHSFFLLSFFLLKAHECTNQKKKVLCRVCLRVGVMCVPCSEYLHLLSWLNREAGALTQSASEDEEEQRALPLSPLPPAPCLTSRSRSSSHLWVGAPEMSRPPEYGCQRVNAA